MFVSNKKKNRLIDIFVIITFVVLCCSICNMLVRSFMDDIDIECEVTLVNEQRDWGGSIPVGSRIHIKSYIGNDRFIGFLEEENRLCNVDIKNVADADELIDSVNYELGQIKCMVAVIYVIVILFAVVLGYLVNRFILTKTSIAGGLKISIICLCLLAATILFVYASKIYCVFSSKF